MTRQYTWNGAGTKQKEFVCRMIREARLARDLSPNEAAAQCGVTPGTFYRWENGRISSATVRIIDWLMHDPTASHDAFYWRERAMLAEEALEGLQRKINKYKTSHAEIK